MHRLRWALSALGAVFTATGVLIFLFVAYQLWGTGLYTARAQSDLKAEFESRAGEQPAPPPPATTTTAASAALPDPPPPPPGEAVATIRIPKIGVDQAVVEGVSLGDLRKGPGHFPSTPLPGQAGNAAIAGHRTTYGAPFNRLDELAAGDEIVATTLEGRFVYRVRRATVVQPSQVEVLDPTDEPRLTLTTCHPKYSAAQRLVVVADLAPGRTTPAPAPLPPSAEGAKPPSELAQAGLSSGHPKTQAALSGLATLVVGAGWWRAVRRRPRWTTHAAGALAFLVVLFVFFANLERLLPANF